MIDNFRGDYYFLSNIYPCTVEYDYEEYTCSEAAYQAAKCCDEMEKIQFISIFMNFDGNVAKRLGKKVMVRPDWEEVKLDIMKDICIAKFTQNKDLMELLLATGDEELVNGNYYGDTFWGVCDGVGENHLGKILMEIRGKYKDIYEMTNPDDYYIDEAGNYYDSYREYREIFDDFFGGVPERGW